jgi:alpha-D-glucose phosphate-specific phosphoglucomutase
MPIKFGTDGWRAVISDEFTFANLRLVSQAVADYARSAARDGRRPVWVIGFDTRFLSDRYAREVAGVFAANDILAVLARSDAPTPAISFAVRHLKADGGVMITASHNPPRYNGFKVKAHYGGSANAPIIKAIEARLSELVAAGAAPAALDVESAEGRRLIERFDPMPTYLEHVRSLIDLDCIAAARPRVVVDSMYGAGRGYMRDFLAGLGCQVHEIRGNMNPGFGGIHPEPIAANLGALREEMAAGTWTIGLATDGDADRIGAMTSSGRFVDPHVIMSLALRYLVERRGQRGAVVKTVSTTQMLNRLAGQYGLPLHETPVGFDHICDLILAQDVLIGGEESGGITIRGHIPEGDGILMGLLLVEVLADSGLSFDDLIAGLMRQTGEFHYGRHDYQVQAFSKAELVKRLAENAPQEIAGLRLQSVSTLDGVKYLLEDESWLLIRPSGTEPVLRVYAEARQAANVSRLLEAGRALGFGQT